MSRAFDLRALRGKANRLFPVAALALCVSPLFVPPLLAVPPLVPAGGLKGVVADIAGHPRMGAEVLLFNRQDKLLRRALTNVEGGFNFVDLVPDVYSIRVTLASFLPAIKGNIQVQAGKLRLLDVSLSTLFSSIQLLPVTNSDARSLMSDDWKWVLRTSSSTRPVLRFLPNPNGDPTQQGHAEAFSETSGMVKVSTGDFMDNGVDAVDLGTAFALATSLYGENHLKFMGNVGYGVDSGAPSGSFRTSYSRDMGDTDPEVSVTMRQLYLPSRMSDSSPTGLRTISISSSNRDQLSDSLEVVYGCDLDVVSFIQRLHYLSPYARVTYTGLGGKIDVSYASGNARPGLDSDDRSEDPELSRDLDALSMIPLVGLMNNQTRVERGDDYEVAYSTKVGSREYRVSGFRQHVSNADLRLANADNEFVGDLLPDPYSSSAIFDAGTFNTMGYTASVTQHVGEHVKVTAMYGSSDVLTAQGSMTTDTADDLRQLLKSVRRGEVTMQASAVIPATGTRLTGSYQFTDYSTINPGEIYSTQTVRPSPGLNFTIRQPIPASFGLPWRMEATADVRNVMAQGYLPMMTAGGQQFLVVQNPRSFRGGLSFIF